MIKQFLAATWLSAVCLAGCDTTTPQAPPSDSEAAVPVSQGQSGAEPASKLTVASWEEIQTLIAAQQGKVVVVDLWSTSCLPCLRELPNLDAMQQRHPEEVVCLTVNLDYTGASRESPEGLRERVSSMLEGRADHCQNLLCSTADEELYELIDLGSIPAVYVYGRDGSLLKRFDNDRLEFGDEGFTYERDINPVVEGAL